VSNADITNTAAAAPQLERLTYTAREACAALGVSNTTLWRLDRRGLIKAVPGIRTKLYAVTELHRFVNSGRAT
jgi:predicted site-specific integrase-resolvase